MSFLFNSINKVNETFKKAGSFNSEIGMFSGFTPIDILSSNIEHFADRANIELINGGIFNFPYTEIGMSASGKTTLWIQIIAACIDNWYRQYGPVSEAIMYNVELHTSPKRVQDVTGWDDQMMAERFRMVNKSWSIIEIFNDLAVLAREKLAHKKELEIDTGVRSIGGESIKILPTTYALIDSIAAVRSKTDMAFDKDGNVKNGETVAGTSNMDAMQIAKDNTLFINEVKKLCEEAKICVIMINHLVEVPVLDRYNPPKPQLPGMKYNQKVKGGTELLYQSYHVGMLSLRERMFNEKSKIYGDNVHGIIAFMDWLKNKNGPEGVRYPMVFDSATGYKPELTDFEVLYSEGGYGIEGSPLSYYLSILPEVKFTRKTLLDKCHENPLLARALCFTTRLYLVSKVLNHEDPVDIKELKDIPYETRVDLILRYSIDYPGYINHGWIVDSDLIEYTKTMSLVLNRKDAINLNFRNGEFNLCKSDLLLLDDEFSCMNINNPFTIGETEYIVGDKEENWFKK